MSCVAPLTPPPHHHHQSPLLLPPVPAGELDVSLAQRPRTPVAVGSLAFGNRPRLPASKAAASPAPRPVAAGAARCGGGRKSSPNLMRSKLVEASGGAGAGAGGAGSGQEGSPRSTASIAWDAFKGNGGGDSLAATVKAAMTATTIAVEHVRKRTRERLLLEKGAGGAGKKRLSGPLQITLEDLQVRRGGGVGEAGRR